MKEIKRGYVKWTDSDGVFHKEPLANFPELLAPASEEQKLEAAAVIEDIHPSESSEEPAVREVLDLLPGETLEEHEAGLEELREAI